MIELGPILSVTLGPLLPVCGQSVSVALERLAECGARSVQLSAAMRGIRPRELDTAARRELRALIARRGMMIGGIDLMIPRKDWTASATQDRATAAAVGAIRLAADMGRVPMAMTLPVAEVPSDVADALIAAADGCGVTLAIHEERNIDALHEFLRQHDQPMLRAAIDPAAVLARQEDVAGRTMQLSKQLAVARLDDWMDDGSNESGRRCAVGSGQLNVTMYRATLAACEKLRSIVVDVRDLPDPAAAIRHAIEQWQAVVG